MTERVTIPTATIDLEGQSYGGAYWDTQDMRLTLVDEGEKAVARAEDASGNIFDQVELDEAQAVRLVALINDEAPSTGIPQLTITPRWVFSDTERHLVLTDDLDEVAGWLRFWLGLDEWNPADTDWEW